MPHSEKPPQRETCTPQLESGPHSPQLEKAHTQQQRLSTTINKNLKLKKKWGLWKA